MRERIERGERGRERREKGERVRGEGQGRERI